ncbi:MAG: PCMD domain-containing protein [Muribaculaceae bacterium]|nr:PCMD domain-containing protein [Muribaculaceae bacterium]
MNYKSDSHVIHRNILATALSLLMMTLMTSCFGEEPDGCEADIETVTLHADNPEQFFFQLTDSMQVVFSTDNEITFAVRGDADVSALSPILTLSAGATVEPASGSTHDFSHGPVTYTVTSQDGKWQRSYSVSVIPTLVTVSDTLRYDFEHFELETATQRYYIWHNVLPDGTLGNDWSTANAGFRISMSTAKPEEYPSTPLLEGYDGAAVCLTTRDTGPFGRMANKRLAAGNLFLGTFDIRIAMSDHLHATRFGLPFTSRPDRFTGYYTYQPGETVQDFNGNPIAGRIDTADVYAVFYRNHDAAGNELVLYGDNILSSEQIVAVAKLGYVAPTSQWTPWDVKFEYREEIDEELLANRGYSLAIVFSSSSAGGDFIGAIGSRLCIDKVRLICSHEE